MLTVAATVLAALVLAATDLEIVSGYAREEDET